MKYQALIEYEYPVDHPKPVGAAIYLHGEKIIADSVQRVKMPEVMRVSGEYITVVESDGTASRWEKKGFKKTGRHFLQIREVLKQMQEGNE